MAIVKRLSEEIIDAGSFDPMQSLVINYWGSPINEKAFPIPLWKLNQLFVAANSEEIAFRVENIEQPAWVTGEWVVFGDNFEQFVQPPNEPGVLYFVMEEDTFNNIKAGVVHIEPQKIMITARLGKTQPPNEEIVLFMVASECNPIPPGGGGVGAASGIRIPPSVQ